MPTRSVKPTPPPTLAPDDPAHPRYALYKRGETAMLAHKEKTGHSAIRDPVGTAAAVIDELLANRQEYPRTEPPCWYGPPTERGWYWHHDGDMDMRLHFVSQRPGHSYLCVQDEPHGHSMKRQFRAVARMGGKWSAVVMPPAADAPTRERP